MYHNLSHFYRSRVADMTVLESAFPELAGIISRIKEVTGERAAVCDELETMKDELEFALGRKIEYAEFDALFSLLSMTEDWEIDRVKFVKKIQEAYGI